VAAVKSANATRDQMDAKLYQAGSDWQRAQKLKSGEALSESDYNNYQAAFKTANANLAVAVAAIAQAEAGVLQAKATVDKAQRNLDFCTIKSPVKGVVIDRRVNIGQTVVASLNTPSLFLIAKDLTQVEVWVSVNEADIGKVHSGQPVTFSVDAFPGHAFHGEVGKVRLNATMTQNVVTYTVEVNTDNSDGKLLPYMTANVQFEITRRKDVLLVPNGALRWYPQPEMVAPEVRAAVADKSKKLSHAETDDGATDTRRNAKRARAGAASKPTTRPVNNEPHGHGTLWVYDGKYVRPVKVRTGVTDGINTEIALTDVALNVGTQLVTGEQKTQSGDSGTTNPFAPQQMFGRRH
jgi:HlyD family secretion protein